VVGDCGFTRLSTRVPRRSDLDPSVGSHRNGGCNIAIDDGSLVCSFTLLLDLFDIVLVHLFFDLLFVVVLVIVGVGHFLQFGSQLIERIRRNWSR